MGRAKGVIDVDIPEPGQAGPERLHLVGIGLELGAVFQLYLPFFLDMKPEVLQQNHVPGLCLGARGLHVGTDAIIEKLHRFSEQFRQRVRHRLQGKLLDALPVRTTQMAHQHHGSPLVERVANRRQRCFNALGVGDGASDFVLGHVKVHADEGAPALQCDLFNKKFGHKIKSVRLPCKQGGRGYHRSSSSKVNSIHSLGSGLAVTRVRRTGFRAQIVVKKGSHLQRAGFRRAWPFYAPSGFLGFDRPGRRTAPPHP